MLPSAKTQAAGAPVEVDVSKIEPGQRIVVEWRGRPVWVVHRTPEMVEPLAELNDQLRDPLSEVESQTPPYARNVHRSVKPEYLIVIGLCTHLGCTPNYEPEPGAMRDDWPGGFLCPCHGGEYDLAGRVFKGVPPPANLEVPPHKYLTDVRVLVGEEEKGVA